MDGAQQKGNVLFWANNLARSSAPDCLRPYDWRVASSNSSRMIGVDCTDVGHGDQASFIWVAISIGASAQRRISSVTPLVSQLPALQDNRALRHIARCRRRVSCCLLRTRAAKAVSARAVYASAYELQAGCSAIALVCQSSCTVQDQTMQRSPVALSVLARSDDTDRLGCSESLSINCCELRYCADHSSWVHKPEVIAYGSL